MTCGCLSFSTVALRSSSWALETPTPLSCSSKIMKSMKMSAPAGKKYFLKNRYWWLQIKFMKSSDGSVRKYYDFDVTNSTK